jgi:UDP-GlcNAc:undecaprenyl-phosphate GlcNAc-1-phosphate transferase
MPLLGGLAIAAPFLGVCILGILGPTAMLQAIAGGKMDLGYLALGCAAIVALGVVDDMRGMKARMKLLVQLVAALLICAAGHTIVSMEIPFLGTVTPNPLLGLIITVLWIVGITNAFNLIDGVDGLAAGVAFIASVGLAIIAAANGATFVVLLCLALAGSLLAFLAFNFHPARIFLGDTGSMFLGFSLATVALMGSYKSQAAVIFVAPMLALGFPIFETLVSMLRRLVHGRPVFVGDQGHTHHRLLRKGFSQRQVAMTLYAVALLCMVSAILCQILSAQSRASWAPIGLYVATVMGLAWVAGYLQPNRASNGSGRRQRNLLLSALARYAALSLTPGRSLLNSEVVLRIARRELNLRFLEAWFEEEHVLIASSGRMSLDEDPDSPHDLDDPPSFIAPRGFAMNNDADALPVCSLHETRVQSANGRKIIIRYQYYQEPDEFERQDVVACLANLFEQARISRPLVQPKRISIHKVGPRFASTRARKRMATIERIAQ